MLAACGGGGGTGIIVPPPPPANWGKVIDTDVSAGAGVHAVVAGADVVLVPAAEIEAIDSIQPMEDAAQGVKAGMIAGGYMTTTDAQGEFTFAGVADGDYFAVVLPNDANHVPGGFREHFSVVGGVPIDPDTGLSAIGDVEFELVNPPTSAATYIGSTLCQTCHPKAAIKHTLHNIGLRKIGATGAAVGNANMDLTSTSPWNLPVNLAAAMSKFTPDTSGGPTKYTLAGTTDDFWLGIDATGPYFRIGLVTNPKFRVYLTYGGDTGKWKSRYITQVGKTDGMPATLWGANNQAMGSGNGYGYYEMAPMQFQEGYTDGSNGISGPFVAYHNDRWDFAGGGGFTADVKVKSWDVNCAACHGATGVMDTGTEWVVQFPADANGYTLNDGTTNKYQINNSCEKCHGPGSEHVAAGGQGKNIVMPDLLTAGRLTMICGTCHIRGGNNTAIGGEVPYVANGSNFDVFRPGMAPAAFFGRPNGTQIAPYETDLLTSGYLSPINFLTNKASWKDKGFTSANPFVTASAAGPRTQVTGSINHSKGHHQQFFDLTRTKMYKNDNELVTCIDCHDAHGSPYEHQMALDADNNAICLTCHNDSLRAPGAGETAPDTALEGKHPANFQFITQAMADRLGGHTNTGADDLAIGGEVMRHVGLWANSFMGSTTYDPEGASKMGRCTTCHMPKTAKSASYHNELLSTGSNQYLAGDIHAHTFDVMTTEALDAMFLANSSDPTKVTPSGMTHSCGTCHTALVK